MIKVHMNNIKLAGLVDKGKDVARITQESWPKNNSEISSYYCQNG